MFIPNECPTVFFITGIFPRPVNIPASCTSLPKYLPLQRFNDKNMKKINFNKRQTIRFKHFSRRGYALFSCLGKEVIVGTLSVATLTHAKADGISTRPTLAEDSLNRQELKLDEVVITGSRAPLTALQSAKIVSVITRGDIDRAAVTSVNDLLKTVTGVDVRQRGGFGVQTDISINGGTYDQVTILLNGINISNPQTGHNAADFPVSLDDIERIEVLEGASARVFGSSAFSGAINIVTKVGAESHAKVSAEGGSFGTFGTHAGITLSSDAWRNRMSGGYTQSDGGTINTQFKKRQAYYQGGFSSHHIDLNWQAGIISKDYGAGTFYGIKSNDQYEETRRFITSIAADIHDLPAQLTISPAVYWHRNHDHYQYFKGKTGANMGKNIHRTDIYGASLNTHFIWAGGKTALGADVRKEVIYSTAYGELLPTEKWKDIAGSERQYERKGERTNTGLFVEHNIVWDKFTLSAGLLANRNTWLGDSFRFYPGIDLSYRPTEHWKFFASWNKALRVPTYTDLYVSNSAQVGDLNLKPERTSTFKLGARYRRTGLETVLNSFYSRGRDMIDWVFETSTSTRYHALNIGKLDNMGASLDATVYLPELMSNSLVTKVKVGYAYIHQRHETEQAIYRSLYALEYLRHKFVMNVDHRIVSRLSASWALRWQQRMNGFHPYTKLDCKVQWTTPRYQLYLQADNLTAHRYYDIGGVKQPGLWIMAGGSVKIGL